MSPTSAGWTAAVLLAACGGPAAAQEKPFPKEQRSIPAEDKGQPRFAYREIRGPQLQPGATGPFQHINQVAFTRDGARMAAGAGATIHVWDVADGKELVHMQLPTPQIYHRLVFGPDDKTLVWCGREDPMIRVWDVATGRQLREFRQPSRPPREFPQPGARKRESFSSHFLTFSPDGKRAAFNGPSFFQGLDILDIATGQISLRIKEQKDCRGCAFSPDGKWIAALSGNGGLHLWDARTGKLVREFRADDRFAGGAYKFVSFSPDGTFLGTGGHLRDGLEVWNVASGKVVCTVPGKVFFYSASFSQDNQSVVCVPADGRTFLYHLVAEKVIYRFNPPERLAHTATFTPDGKRVAIVAELSDQLSKGRQDAIFLYDVPRAALNPAAAQVDDAALEKLWTELSSVNDLRLQRVQQAFRAAPAQAVAQFRKKLAAVTKEQQKKVEYLITKLDASAFAQRDEAMQELRQVAFRFTPLLEARKDQAGPGEIRNRLTFLLNEMKEQPTPAGLLKEQRALKLLEEMATPAARELLTELAAGAPLARRTVAARAALARMTKDTDSDK